MPSDYAAAFCGRLARKIKFLFCATQDFPSPLECDHMAKNVIDEAKIIILIMVVNTQMVKIASLVIMPN